MGTLSTHVLDTSLGMPARGVRVRLEAARPGPEPPGAGGTAPPQAPDPLGEGVTDEDGRLATIGPERLGAGRYRLTFDSGAYFERGGRTGFYPEVVVVFTVADPDEHYHVPVLLAPHGYTTYRGS